MVKRLVPGYLDPRRLHQRGHRGGAIGQHRSIRHLRLPTGRLLQGLAIALGFSALLALAQPAIAQAWNASLLWWLMAMGLPGQHLPAPLHELGLAQGFWQGLWPGPWQGFWAMPVVVADLQLPGNGPLNLAAHALVVVAVWLAAGWLPDAARPGAYLLRLVVLVHAASLLYFAVWPASFAHSAASHVGGGLRQVWALMLLTPWIHFGTFYLFPFRAWQRIALTAVTLAYLAVLGPLLYASHAALLAALGLVVMPVLHLLFGVLVPILGLVALYGWGMGWHDPARPGDAQGAAALVAKP